MRGPTGRALALLVGLLTIMAIATAPAHARFTPAGAAISGSSRDSSFTRGTLRYQCATSTFRGTIAADGLSISGKLAFSSATGGTTCVATLGISCPVTGSLTLTLRSTASTAGNPGTATGNISIDGDGSRLSEVCPLAGIDCTVSGPQTIGTFSVSGTLLTIRASRLTCRNPDGTTSTSVFTASYTLDRNLTVS